MRSHTSSETSVINNAVYLDGRHVASPATLADTFRMLEREAGLEIGRATLDGWVMRVGELLAAVVQAMRKNLLREAYLQADETTVPVQMHDRRGSNHEAYLWQYGRPGGETVFDFCMGRGREGPRKFLGNWEGILQTDGYQAYDGVGGPKLVHVGCWAHARRPWWDLYVSTGRAEDSIAAQALRRISALYAAGLSVVGLRLAIPIGVLTGCMAFVPYIGFATGDGKLVF